jgi:hypothetical protein
MYKDEIEIVYLFFSPNRWWSLLICLLSLIVLLIKRIDKVTNQKLLSIKVYAVKLIIKWVLLIILLVYQMHGVMQVEGTLFFSYSHHQRYHYHSMLVIYGRKWIGQQVLLFFFLFSRLSISYSLFVKIGYEYFGVRQPEMHQWLYCVRKSNSLINACFRTRNCIW